MSARVEFVAFVLQTSERPFERWAELSQSDKDAFEKKARRVLEAIRHTQPQRLETLLTKMAAELAPRRPVDIDLKESSHGS